MVSKSKTALFLATLLFLGCSKSPQVPSLDADAQSIEVDASSSIDLGQDATPDIDVSKDSSPSAEG